MKRYILLSLCFFFTLTSGAQEVWYGIYLKNAFLGYGIYSITDQSQKGQPVKKIHSRTWIQSNVLGSVMNVDEESSSLEDQKGNLIEVNSTHKSSGRTQNLSAKFKSESIDLTLINGGETTQKTLPKPKEAPCFGDLTTLLFKYLSKNERPKNDFYALNPFTASLMKISVDIPKNKEKNICLNSPIGQMNMRWDSKGKLVKIEGPFGIEIIPETKEKILSKLPGLLPIDLVAATSIKIDPQLSNPLATTYLKIETSNADLSALPNDDHQTLTKKPDHWMIELHPVQKYQLEKQTIDQIANICPEWLEEDLYMSSKSSLFKDLTDKIKGKSTDLLDVALNIKNYVFNGMKFNSGIGVLRSAHEVLHTKEGVCRDYAILTATLLRSANIPTRLIGGLVSFDGKTFAYHAWVEIWTGKKWFGIDSTRLEPEISASYIKLAQGKVQDVFLLNFFDQAHFKVLEVKTSLAAANKKSS